MRELFRFLHHISKVGSADGGKRIWYAILHIVAVALAVLFAFLAYKIFTNIDQILSRTFFVGLLLIIFGIAITVFGSVIFFLQGVVAQIALIIFSSIDIKHGNDRGANSVALTIAVLSMVVFIGAVIVLFMIL